MTPELETYLRSRGYDDASLKEEDVQEVTGTGTVAGQKIGDGPCRMAWPVRSELGRLIGVQTRELEQKKYRWYQVEGAEYLPPLYGTPHDWQVLAETRTLVLVEGIFDRRAMKAMLPEHAVLARCTKGIGKLIVRWMERNVDSLWLAFDQDDPGREAAEEAEEKLPNIECYRLTYPQKDPSKLLEKLSLPRARALIKQQMERMQ